jgi:hypothetical protein
MLIKSGRALGTKLVAHIYKLSGGAFTSLERGGPVEHGVGPASAAVKPTGLGIDKNLVCRGYGRQSATVLNDGETGLELVRHLYYYIRLFIVYHR